MHKGPEASSRRHGLTLNLALAVLFLLAGLASAYALAGAGERVDASTRSVVTAPSQPPSPVTSLWFGDSIVEGCCRTIPESPTMAEEAARRLGWAEPVVAGAGGTGYLTARTIDGVRSGPYPERIAAAVEGASYDVVVIAGGNNDATDAFDPVAFRASVRAVLAQVRKSLPEAVLVVLGPYSPDGTGYVDQRRIEQQEAERVGAGYIDQVASGWMRAGPDLLHSDGFHPNDRGQALLGAKAAAALREVLPARLTAARAAVA